MSNRFQPQSNHLKNSYFPKNSQNQENLNYRRPQTQAHSSNSLQNTQNSYMNHTNENSLNSPYRNTKQNNSVNENRNPLIENSIKPTILDTSGNRPLPRFGQSLVSISPVKLLLFGGAVGDVKNFRFSNEVFLFNLMTRIWSKTILEKNSPVPKERAAHAASSNNDNQMIIHGGSVGGQGLAEDELWVFQLRKDNEDFGFWKKILTYGKSPGKRYGHTLSYLNPIFILFGGSCNYQLLNDVWVIDIKNPNPNWFKLEIKNNIMPSPRLYQTCGFCEKGEAKGMLLLFGGRDSNENPLNDIWGLTRHRDGSWTWNKAPINDNNLIRT